MTKHVIPRPIRILPVFVAAIAAAAVGLWMRDRSLASRPAIDRFIDASAFLPTRPIPARLSASFPYKEYRAQSSEAEQLEGRRAILAAQVVVRNDPSAAGKHAVGVSYLFLGELDAGRLQLEDALRRETRSSKILAALRECRDADLLNDLAAAYQALFVRTRDFGWRTFAVEAAQRAWTLKRSPAIAFTRAVVLESLHVRESAIAAWSDFLALDASSPWTNEANARLTALRAPTQAERWPTVRQQLAAATGDRTALRALVDANRQAVRLWCEDELLPQWGEAILRGDAAAATKLLSTARGIGEALRDANGERDGIDAVEAIDRASDRQREHLARGHSAYGQGRKAIIAVEAQRALRETSIAVANLPPELTPFARRARIEHAAAVYLSNDYEGVLKELAALPLDTATHATVGRVEWARGLTRGQLGAPEAAIAHYQRALEEFRSAGENDNECMIHSLLASALENSGSSAEADVHRDRAMEILERTGNVNRGHIVIFEAALAAVTRDTPAVADVMLDSVVTQDTTARNSFYACNALMWRGAYRFRRGLRSAAAGDLLRARDFCGAIEDPQARARATANLGLAHATLEPGQLTANDLRDLDVAVAYFQEQKNGRWLRTAYVARARAHAASGSPAAAESDFLAALREVGSIRSRFDARDARVSFTATADDIVDAYVEFLLGQHRERDAFEIADRNRSRELVDAPEARWESDSARSIPPRLQRVLPAGAAIIEYRVLDEAIVAWVIRGGSVSVTTLPARMSDLGTLLQQMDDDPTPGELSATGARLHEALLQPISSFIGPTDRLVIVPDGVLERVPFAALYDAGRRRFLMHDHATVVAPSAALYAQAAARFADRSTREENIVVIDAASRATGPAIPAAVREARLVAAMFPRSRIVSGPEVVAAAPEATFLHFSGHGEREAEGAIRALRLGDASAGRLAPAQIVSLSLPMTRLVYLSACETDNGPVLRSEGSVTAARSFFAAGVPVVVATLWPVEDGVAHDIARLFYEALRDGVAPAEALRRAQWTVWSRKPDATADWAAFRVIGGGIEPPSPTNVARRAHAESLEDDLHRSLHLRTDDAGRSEHHPG